MEQLKVGFASESDHKELLEWLNLRPEFDQGILKYPTLQLLKSYNGKAVAYLPIHRALILESSAIAPGTPELLSMQALRDFVKASELIASSSGIRELYFMGTDKRLNRVASSANVGFEQLKWPALRLKL